MSHVCPEPTVVTESGTAILKAIDLKQPNEIVAGWGNSVAGGQTTFITGLDLSAGCGGG